MTVDTSIGDDLRVLSGVNPDDFNRAIWHNGNMQRATPRVRNSLPFMSLPESRDPKEPLLGGVCSEIACTYGATPLAVRAAFLVLTIAGGFGLVAYGVLAVAWRKRLYPRTSDARSSTLTNAEQGTNNPNGRFADLGVGFITAGTLWVLQSGWPGFRSELVIPVALVALGLVVSWRDDHASIDSPSTASLPTTTSRSFGGIFVRIGAGAILILAAFATIASQSVSVWSILNSGLAIGVAVCGLAIVGAPPLMGFAAAMNRDREQRVRDQERAELAAHLHDSVLQTLTLIQKRSAEPTAVSAIARRQERELRRWLYGGMVGALSNHGGGWAYELQRCVDEVEDRYELVIESVILGDAEMTDSLASVIAAAREALVNAAKFSGESKISLFAEVADGTVSLFVRDRGNGFDFNAIGDDRRGISESIIRRIHTIGGTATINTSPGTGCEVALLVHQNAVIERSRS